MVRRRHPKSVYHAETLTPAKWAPDILVTVLAAPPVRGAKPPAAPIRSRPEHPTTLPATSREGGDGRNFTFATDDGKVTRAIHICGAAPELSGKTIPV